MSTTEEYKAAMNELAAATLSYKPIATFIKSLNDATAYNMVSFLRANFGAIDPGQRRGERADPKYKVNMNAWPSGNDVASASQRLATAFNNAHSIYDDLPSDDKEYVRSPPHQPEIDVR